MAVDLLPLFLERLKEAEEKEKLPLVKGEKSHIDDSLVINSERKEIMGVFLTEAKSMESALLDCESELKQLFPYYCRIEGFIVQSAGKAVGIQPQRLSEETRDAFTLKMVDFLKTNQRQLKDLQLFYHEEIQPEIIQRPLETLGAMMLDIFKASVPTFVKQTIVPQPLKDPIEKLIKKESENEDFSSKFFQGILCCLESHLSLVTRLFVKMQRLEKHERHIATNYKR